VAILIFTHVGMEASSPLDLSTPLFPSPNERFGFGVTGDINQFDVSQLNAGWYVNWGTVPQSAHPAGLEFVQIIRLCDSAYRYCNHGWSPRGSQLETIIRNNLGSTWLIGNEPDTVNQDGVGPETYAEFYHDLYDIIKGIDPTAQVAIGGMVQATPLRMRWLNLAWDAYQARYGTTMPVDVWNVHNFVLREVRAGHARECPKDPDLGYHSDWGCGIPPGLPDNCGLAVGANDLDNMDLFKEQIVRFRRWMADHGQRNKPLIVSEYGILFNEELGYPYWRVRNYMLATFDYFLNATDPNIGYPADGNRLVQRWAWYSLDDDSFVWGTTWSALFDPETKQIKKLGQDFANYTRPLVVPYYDLYPASLNWQSPVYGQPLTVTVIVKNRGNTSSPASKVRLWNSSPGGTLLGEAPVPGVPSRYAGSVSATLTTPAIDGPRHIYAQVDANNVIDEANENNNQINRYLGVDLAMEEVRWTPRVPFAWSGHLAPVQFQITVRNRGDVTVPGLKIGLWDKISSSQYDFAGNTTVTLAPGETVTVTLMALWEVGDHHPWAKVDGRNLVHESDERNNLFETDLTVQPFGAFFPLAPGG
ncbi:MAG TPA: hypothetical protein EYH31_07940, partial [Anaerolineae bacterium]|nr:hypothetical protein [Anaerolineae bacterium]